MRKIYFILIANCLLLISNCYSQPVTQEWVRKYSGLQSNYGSSGKSVKLDSSGNVYVLVRVATDSTLGDYGLLKYSPSGSLLWTAYYNSPGNLSEQSHAFAVTGDGDVYITGNTGINFSYHILTVKISSEGFIKWAKVYNGGGPGDDAFDIAVDKQGNISITGGSEAINGSTSYSLTIKYNSNGDTLWTRKLTQLGLYSVTTDLVTDDSSNVYTTGYYEPLQNRSYFLTLKYNTNGSLMWYSTYYFDPGYQQDLSYFIAIDTNRNVYVAGISHTLSPGYNDNSLLKINSNGVLQWARVYKGISGNNSCGQPSGVACTPDGYRIYYTTISENETLNGSDFVTLAYNSVGDSVWVRRYPTGIFGIPSNNPVTLKLDKYGNVYVPGNTINAGVIVKYLENGSQQWVVTSDSSGEQDLTLDTSLNVYVTGGGIFNNVRNAVTLKYNQVLGIISNNNQLPTKYKLYQNYPNPFNSITVITYELPHRSNVKLTLYNVTGQLVRTLVNTEQNSGYYSIAVNMDDLASGVYFYKIEVRGAGSSTGFFVDTKKLVLVK